LFVLEKIEYSKIEELLVLLRERSKWLESIDKPMWNPAYLDSDSFIQKYQNPSCFLAKEGENTIGGFILLEKDDGFWSESFDNDVFYIHKLVVDKRYEHRGYGKKILLKIADYAKKEHKLRLRIDYYKDRKNLETLYTEVGFSIQEELVMPDGIVICKCEKTL